ncbi:hypothetical protein MYMA111404_01810 [Mycoplasma marinum]|uniref:Uncharacterized protein n=1 Tax=Mycoplasma marinum TaxID=1937190 RepID=A0A4R0XVS1_9MOLU|nr:hypothetical protein [Mycoplasma marinum]TCG11885.1 hypothetical protein C4B24_00620 [Mycoplasma marinum]
MFDKLKINKGILIFATFSFVFLILSIISDTVQSLNWTVFSYYKNNDISKMHVPIEHVSWISIFYFTFQTNLIVFIFLLLRGLGIIKPKEKLSHKLFQLITVVNITITMCVYWTVLAPFSSIWTHGGFPGVFKRVVTILVHFVAPVFMIITYHIDKLKKGENGVILNKKHIFYILIYPILWIVMAIIVYYASREANTYTLMQNPVDNTWFLSKDANGTIHRKIGVAIYFFLNFDEVKIYITISIIIGITLLFLAFGSLFISLSNPNSRINSLKIKRK